MISHEEKAINLFNRSLKVCISMNIEPTKDNAKELLLFDILLIKESLFDLATIDKNGYVLNSSLKKYIDYWQKIQKIIENL
jgi:hypothetical protein